MSEFTVSAEYAPLESVRVHMPGYETLAGIVDPQPNLFRSRFSLAKAHDEHERIVEVLEAEGVDVHYLHDDFAASDRAEALLDEIPIRVREIDADRKQELRETLRSKWRDLGSAEQLQLIACNMTVERHFHEEVEDELGGPSDLRGFGNERLDTTNINLGEPMANLYFQRDQQLVTANGPVMGAPAFPIRAREVDVCRAAWEGIGASIFHDVPSDLCIEGGDYIPAGDFCLLGVYDQRDDERRNLRTSLETAHHLLEQDAFGHDEVALVEAPYDVDQRVHRQQGEASETAMEIMHLDTWFNIAADGIGVGRKRLVEGATVQVYVSEGSEYVHHQERNFAEYLDEKGYRLIPVEYDERAIATNFLTLSDRTVLAPCYTNRDDEYVPGRNQTLERLRDAGVEIVPNGEGIPITELRKGYGGIHCMTTPLNRRS
jgi:arginine deiminase